WLLRLAALFFVLLLPPPPSSPLFPYTTLFRSDRLFSFTPEDLCVSESDRRSDAMARHDDDCIFDVGRGRNIASVGIVDLPRRGTSHRYPPSERSGAPRAGRPLVVSTGRRRWAAGRFRRR